MHTCVSALLFLTAAAVSLRTPPPKEKVFRWPTVAATTEIFKLAELSRGSATLRISTTEGKQVYWLGCRGADFKGELRDPHHDTEDYYGTFDCHLHSISGDDRANLLVDDASDLREDFSRMSISPADLEGVCGSYPEWGRVRHVRLRGMVITFEFASSNTAGKELVLTVRVEQDPSALSAIAEPPSFLAPSEGHCETVVQSHVPGAVTQAYIDYQRLGPPYAEIAPTAKTMLISSEHTVEFEWPDKPLPPNARAFYMSIHDKSGKLAYRFECSAYVGVKGIDRWGIPCGLFAADGTVNLLQDSLDLYSRLDRATIFPEQLHGDCAGYPEWGAVRTFWLRGLSLTIRLTDPMFASGEFHDFALKRARMSVEVKPDPSAKTAVALPSRYVNWELWPGRTGCSHPLLGPEEPGIIPSRAETSGRQP